MHVQDARAFVLRNFIEDALARCTHVATEAPLDDLSGLSGSMSMYLPKGQCISDLITPAQYQRLRRIVRKVIGIDVDHFNRMRPMVLQNLIAESMLLRQRSTSLDAYLWQKGKELDLACLGIESAVSQLETLEKLPIQQQVRDLLGMARQISQVRKKINHTADLYAAGDYLRLYQITKRSLGKLRKTLLYDRNAYMTKRIDELTKASPTFCAVGAAHLAGEKGVLRGLKHLGFSLHQIKR